MRALTVCEPFASALIFGGKNIENRQRDLRYRGPLLIHAGLSLRWFTPENCEWVNKRWSGCPANPIAAMHLFKHRLGKVIGVLYMDAPVSLEDSQKSLWREWATGPVCHPCLLPHPVTPFTYRGNQGVFTIPSAHLPADVIAAADDICNGRAAEPAARAQLMEPRS